MEVKPLLTVEEVAEFLSVAPLTVYREVKRGNLPAFKLGGILRFAWPDVQLYLDLRRTA